MKKKVIMWAFLQKPQGYKKWMLCPTENPMLFKTKKMALHQMNKRRMYYDVSKYSKLGKVEVYILQ